MTVLVKSYSPPPISRNEILRYAGAKGNIEEIESLLDISLCEINMLIYRVCYTELPISVDGSVDLGFMKTGSETAKKALAGCDTAVVFTATVGIELDRLIARYSVTSPARALMLQAIGAERVEALCDVFCRDVAGGRFAKPRFSAGYGDFSIEAQRDIFALLDCPKRIGVTLNDSLLMSPTKSVTAIFGVKNENT